MLDKTVSLTMFSSNQKTGSIPVSSTVMESCPQSCAMHEYCYAKLVFYMRYRWEKIPKEGLTWAAFCEQIASLPPGMPWRHNQMGDLPGEGDHIDRDMLDMIIDANHGKRGWTYSHKPVLSGSFAGKNRESIAQANRKGFSVCLSADNPAMADELADLGIAPVVTVLPWDCCEDTVTPSGRPIRLCSHYRNTLMQCVHCMRCHGLGNHEIIGFPAHGRKKKAIPF